MQIPGTISARKSWSPPKTGALPMIAFASLLAALDAPPATRAATLAAWLPNTPEPDRIAALALLSGRRPRRIASPAELRLWVTKVAGLPDWLFAESLALTRDPAETAALILPAPTGPAPAPGLADTLTRLAALSGQPEAIRREALNDLWSRLPPEARIPLNRLATASFRLTLPRPLLAAALSQATGLPAAALAETLAHTLGPDLPLPAWSDLLSPTAPPKGPPAIPALAAAPTTLGPAQDWLADWAWPGLPLRLDLGPTGLTLRSPDDILTDRFPGLAPLADHLPNGTTLDATLLVWPEGANRPAAPSLPQRPTRNTPLRLIAHDLLRAGTEDLTHLPLPARRAALADLLTQLPRLPLSPGQAIPFPDWPTLAAAHAQSRDTGATGLILRHRHTDTAWHWPAAPLTARAVLLYVQTGPTPELTLALRDGATLAPVARLPLPPDGGELLRWTASHTTDRFGPVRQVTPERVYEIAFDGVTASPRRRAGLTLTAPRLIGARPDLGPDDIDSLDHLRALA